MRVAAAVLTHLKAAINNPYQVTGDIKAALQLSHCALHIAAGQCLGEIGKAQGCQKCLNRRKEKPKRVVFIDRPQFGAVWRNCGRTGQLNVTSPSHQAAQGQGTETAN